MANNFITNQDITFEALRILKNSLKFVPNLNRNWEKDFGNTKHQIGQTISIRRPNRFTTRLGQTYAPQAIIDTFVPLTLNIQRGCDVQLSSIEKAVDVESLTRILNPQISQLANDIDNDGLLFAKNVTANMVGTPGTTATTNLVYLQAGQKLDEMAAPDDGDRCMIINPAQRVGIVNSSLTQFNPTKEISRQYTKGMIGEALGFEWYQDQNVAVHVFGTYSGSPTVNGAGQIGSSLITQAWGASSLNQGDTFTIAGVHAVNPQNRISTGALQQFVVTSAVAGTGALTLSIYPPIQPSGSYQNVDSSPANGAAIVVLGGSGVSSPQAIGFHPDAYTVGFIDLEVFGGVDAGYMQRDPETGISLRYMRQYVGTTDQLVSRFDVVYGYAATYPELGVRVAG